MLKRFTLLFSLLFLISCSSGPMDTRLTAENKNQVAAEAFKSMADAEKQLLVQYMMRKMMAAPMTDAFKAMTGDKAAQKNLKDNQYEFLPEGKTLREVLQEQQKWNAENKP